MTPAEKYIRRLEELKEGDRSRLRGLAGRPLDATITGFDIFTGLWWPLREKSPAAPRRGPAWLIAKLFCAFRIPHIRPDGPSLPAVLGRFEPRDENAKKRFRTRFDALLCSSMPSLEPHLRWALSEIAKAENMNGIDWVQLLDDISIWDRGKEHRYKRDVRDIWAEIYLNATLRKT